MKKAIILNAGPRKNFNTATLLKEARKGAEAAGAETEFINLFDLNYKGCISCFACKLKGNTTNGLCAYKDELRPVLEKIVASDAVIIGSPVYYSYPTGTFRNLMERMLFAASSYMIDEETGLFLRRLKRRIPTGLIFTMNITKDLYKHVNYHTILGANADSLDNLYGYCEILNSYDTYQFSDYSKYECNMFNEQHKSEVRDAQFPVDMEQAFNLGKRLVEMNLE